LAPFLSVCHLGDRDHPHNHRQFQYPFSPGVGPMHTVFVCSFNVAHHCVWVTQRQCAFVILVCANMLTA